MKGGPDHTQNRGFRDSALDDGSHQSAGGSL